MVDLSLSIKGRIVDDLTSFFSWAVGLFGLLVACSGCATIFGDSKDLIIIHSSDPQADISVDGNVLGKGSAQHSVSRGDRVTITASKRGCSPRSVRTERELIGAFWLNLLFWPGFIVDAATGKLHKTDPTSYTVTPLCE